MSSLYHPHVEHPLVRPERTVSVGPGEPDEFGRPTTRHIAGITVFCLYCGQPFPQGEERDCRLRPLGSPLPPEVQVPADRLRTA